MRSSTPSVIHVVPSSRWRLRAMEVLPELEPPFKTITGFTFPTVLPGTRLAAMTAWAPAGSAQYRRAFDGGGTSDTDAPLEPGYRRAAAATAQSAPACAPGVHTALS
jgi:hypothetical protein